MNKYITLIFSLLILIINTNLTALEKSTAQQIDSIVSILPQLEGRDKLNAIIDLITLNNGLPSQKQYWKMLLNEARNQKHTVAEGYALANLAGIYYSQFDTDSLFIVGEEAIRFTRQHKMYDELFYLQQQFIRRYQRQGQSFIALNKAEEAYREAKELNEKEPMARMLATIANIYNSMEQYSEAERYYLESIELTTDLMIITANYEYMSFNSRLMNRPEDVLRYADSMQVSLDRYTKHCPECNMQIHYFTVEYLRSVAYSLLKQPEQALQSIRKAEAIYDPQWSQANIWYSAQIDDMYATYYFETKNYDKMMQHIIPLLDYYEKTKWEYSLQLIKRRIAQLHFEKGDYKTAASKYKEILERKDSVNQEKFYVQINELRTIYELDKAQLESERQQAANQRLQIIIFGMTVVCISLLAIVLLVVWNRRRILEKNKRLYKKIKEQDRLEEELEKERKKNRNLQTNEQIDKEIKNTDEELFQKLNELIKEHQLFKNKEIKREEVSKKIGISDRSLHDCIKNNTGVAFSEYINQLRLSFSRQLIQTKGDKLTIEAIAKESGFNSRTTFYRLFSEKYGMAPEEFRRIVKNMI